MFKISSLQLPTLIVTLSLLSLSATGTLSPNADECAMRLTPRYGVTKISSHNVVGFGIGNTHACTLRANGELSCIGTDFMGLFAPPKLINPKQLVGGNHHMCALDDEGVKCWGSNISGQLNVPNLKSPTHLSSGYYHTCANTSEGWVCWGAMCKNSWMGDCGPAFVPPDLGIIYSFSSGYHQSCALTSSGPRCWGANRLNQSHFTPPSEPLYDIVSGPETVCWAMADRIECKGFRNFTVKTPPLTRIKMGNLGLCGLNAARIPKCWSSEGQEMKLPFVGDGYDEISIAGYVCAARGNEAWCMSSTGMDPL